MTKSILALDIGTVRTGVARANEEIGIPSPLTTIYSADTLVQSVAELVAQESAAVVVVGLPRNLNGESTGQTEYVEQQVEALRTALTIPVVCVDEAVTSRKAEAELKARKKPYVREDIDMLSATYILEDYLRMQHTRPNHV